MRHFNYITLFAFFSGMVNQLAQTKVVGDVYLGPIYNARIAQAFNPERHVSDGKITINVTESIAVKAVSACTFPQVVTIYSCSSTSCGISTGYSDVNPQILACPNAAIQVAFEMADSVGTISFTPTASLSELGAAGGISDGGSAQDPNYFFDNMDVVVPQIVSVAKANNVKKIDIDLEQLSGISQSLMIDFLTQLHDTLSGVTISVAPECPGAYPQSTAPTAENVYGWWQPVLDACPWLQVFIQTYNNWCSEYPYGSYDNFMAILDNWISPNTYYNGYNPSQIVLGLCARDNDANACSTGYASPDVIGQVLTSSIQLYGCTVGAGLWDSYSDKYNFDQNPNGFAISNQIYTTFSQYCSDGQPTFLPTFNPTAPSLAPTRTPSFRPTIMPTWVPTVVPTSEKPTQVPTTAMPTTEQPTQPTSQPSSNPTENAQEESADEGFFSTPIGKAVEVIGGTVLGFVGIYATMFTISRCTQERPQKDSRGGYSPLT